MDEAYNDDSRRDSLEEYDGEDIEDINDPNMSAGKQDGIDKNIDGQYHQNPHQHPHYPPQSQYHNGENNTMTNGQGYDNDDEPDVGGPVTGNDVDGYDNGEEAEEKEEVEEVQDGNNDEHYSDQNEIQHHHQQNNSDHQEQEQGQGDYTNTAPLQQDQALMTPDKENEDATKHEHCPENPNDREAGQSQNFQNENEAAGAAVAMPTMSSPEGIAPTTTGENTPTTTMTPSTPPPSQPRSASTPKSLKQKLSEIPKRLSRLSLLNALRSGTYVVSEPKNNLNDEDDDSDDKQDDDVEAQSKMADDGHPEDVGDRGEVNRMMKPNDNGGVPVPGNGNGNGVELQSPGEEEEEERPLNNKMETDPEVAEQLNLTKRRHSVHRSALTRLLCGLYALVLVVFGIVFALANSLTVKERQHLYYLEVFQIYLYIGSLVVLLYFQICILRGVRIRNNYFESNIRVVIRRSQDNLQLSPSPSRKQTHDDTHQGHSILLTDAEEALLDSKRDPMDQLSTLSTRSQIGLPADGEVAHVGEGINFYLRLGCLAFSIGSVTLDGFHIASYFETENTTTCESYIFIIVYVLHLIFTFVQTFFLFKNHKLVIDKNKASVRCGLMHLLATNLCVWFITVITETAEDYSQQKYSDRNVSIPRGPDEPKSCYEDMTLARTASPYLFPSTIIYSIIAAGIIYRMYQYVGVKVTQRWPSHTSLTSSVPHGAVGMDCEKANKGLFSGLLVAVITLIAIATFFVFESRLGQTTNAIKIFYVTEISLIAITGSCILFGMMKFVQLRFLENFLSLDSVLLVVSLGGAYVYLSFMLISSASKVDEHGITSILSLVVICVGIVESTLQTIFILDGLCRRAFNDGQVEAKPGRAVVTFLLVCNLALWVVSMFEMKKNMVVPFHIEFYGILPWNIILHLCVPLFIYFRFHSAICLSKIWYQAYQKERNV